MPSKDISTSEFVKAALLLDSELSCFDTLAEQFDALGVDSDKGMEKGEQLFSEIQQCRPRMESAMQGLSRSLRSSREKNEISEQLIAKKIAANGRTFARF